MNHKIKDPDWWLFLITVLLLGFGIVMVFDASYSHAIIYQGGDKYYWVKRQILWAVLGLGGLFWGMFVPYEKWKRWAFPGFAVVLLLLIATKLIGHEAQGGQRWIGWGPAKIQPSEFAKLAIVLFLSHILANAPQMARRFWTGVLPLLVVSLFAIVLVERQPDLGTAISMLLTVFILLFAAGARVRVLAGLLAFFAVVIFAVVYHEAQTHSFRWQRLTTFVNPRAAPRDDGYQIIHSQIALGTGGLTGVGFGESREKLVGNLPAQRTDFIFAIVGEELGLAGTCGVLLGFLFLAGRGLHIAATTKDIFGALLATGITGTITTQALLNIAVVTGSIPTTGIPLPFLSYGGSSLIPTLFSIGVLLNISRGVPGGRPTENIRTRNKGGSASVARERLLGKR
ncbi:MAG: putative lipid II flippase FtsW [Armatimonadaceae bacterium]